MLSPGHTQKGLSLIELVIGIAIVGLLMAMGIPSFLAWIQNTKVRSTAESIQDGLQLARAEAVRRNTLVRFQLMSTADANCALSNAGINWVVSRTDATGQCDIAPSDTVNPMTIQSHSGSEGAANITVSAVDPAGGGAYMIIFNGLGRVSPNDDGSTSITRVDITSPILAAADSRPLRVVVGIGGNIKMCDPSVASPDTRACS